jgi:hypothetical protein
MVLQQDDVRGAFVQTGANRLRTLGVEELFQFLHVRQVHRLNVFGRPERRVLRLDRLDGGPSYTLAKWRRAKAANQGQGQGTKDNMFFSSSSD